MKQYNNEKIVISLTSWKKRINTAYKTIDSLLKWCSYCHIVLVLAESEFLNKEADLPTSIKHYIDNNLIELLWVDKNYITYKKSFFTAAKYPNAIIVTADDDKVYTEDFVAELYKYWQTNTNAVITYVSSVPIERKYKHTCHQYGEAVLYPPNYYHNTAIDLLKLDEIFDIIKLQPNDDIFHTALREVLNLTDFITIERNHNDIGYLHVNNEVITNRRAMPTDTNSIEYKQMLKTINDEMFTKTELIEVYIRQLLAKIKDKNVGR